MSINQMVPNADWGAYANGSITQCACGEDTAMLLHGVHDTLDIALCDCCYAAYATDPSAPSAAPALYTVRRMRQYPYHTIARLPSRRRIKRGMAWCYECHRYECRDCSWYRAPGTPCRGCDIRRLSIADRARIDRDAC